MDTMVDSMSILENLRAFMGNRVMFTAVELGLFDFIYQKGSVTAGDISRHLALDLRGVTRLLDCIVVLGFLRKDHDNVYSLTPNGEVMTSAHPSTILPMVKHYAHLWNNWSRLTEVVREGFNPYLEPVAATEDKQGAFIQAMHVVGRTLAHEIAGAYDASLSRRFLDIGGASGTYTIAFLQKYVQLKAVLFDLPSVIPMAKERIEREGLLSRVTFVSGDFYKDELPKDCDLAFLSAIIHQNSPEENLELFKKIYRALVPGGKILIRDHIMNESRTWPPGGTLFAINMLVATPRGDTYTFSEVSEGLKKAGFQDVKLIRSGTKMDCLVEGCKI